MLKLREGTLCGCCGVSTDDYKMPYSLEELMSVSYNISVYFCRTVYENLRVSVVLVLTWDSWLEQLAKRKLKYYASSVFRENKVGIKQWEEGGGGYLCP